MKLERSTDRLTTDNRSAVDTWAKAFGKDQTFTALLQLVADVLDTAASGGDCYMVIGTNRDKSALLVTVTQDRAKGYISALDIRELSEACKSVL